MKNLLRSSMMVALVAGFLGGAFSQMFFAPQSLHADDSHVLKGYRMTVFNKDDVIAGDLEASSGGGLLRLFGDDGNQRLQFGTYSGSYAASEKGQPLIGLTDNSNRLRLLIRLAGANESPVMIFKDTHGQDRMVIGLGMSGPDEEPFIAYVDKNGKKRTVIGAY